MSISFKNRHASFREVMLKDKKLFKFIDLYTFLKSQNTPKIGDHVYCVGRDGQKIDNRLFIVDDVVEPGLVVGRQLLHDGKNYGKPRCLNEYLSLKTDENQLVSVLIDQNHDYMKEQQEKHREKRKISARINRYNKKISENSANWTRESFIKFFSQLKVGDEIYVSNSLLILKNKKYKIQSIDMQLGIVVIGSFANNLFPRTIDVENLLKRNFIKCKPTFFSKEVPIGFDDFSII